MTRPAISLLLPTRGRPALVERLFRSIVETTTHLDHVEVILYADEDDAGSHHLASERVSVTRIIGPRMSMGEYNTACLARARGDIIILANDDMVIRTPGWDDRVAEIDAEFADKIYLAYCNDCFKTRVCTFPILSRHTCELLVEPYPAAYQGAFIDTHLFDLFKRLQQAGFDRIRYLDDVVFEHLHFRTGRAVRDATYRRRGRFEDDPTFIGMAPVRSAGARRLLNVLRGEPLPAYQQPQCRDYAPTGLFSAIVYLTRHMLFDYELPLRWRSFVWCRFIGRYLVSHGFLKRFFLQ
jgi:glycosyltransferase involved in cell wall biosynthesis